MMSMPSVPLRELSVADRHAIDGDAVVLPKAGVLKAPFPTAIIDPQAKQQALEGLLALHHGAEGDAADHCWQPARREEPASDGGTLDDELRRRLGVG